MGGVVEEVAADVPLRQGDLLEGVDFWATAGDGKSPSPLKGVAGALVLSRHCNAIRDQHVVVAAIKPYVRGGNLIGKISKGDPDFKQARAILATLRDGPSTPDQFYLGEVPALGQERVRLHASLKLLSTLVVPAVGAARAAWIEERRVGTLTSSYRRHLHTRLFGAFAPEGFNDHACWSDGDLMLLIRTADVALATSRLKADVSDAVGGGEGKGGKKTKKGPSERDAFEIALQPYREEAERRGLVD